ncbi:MAG: DUF3810 family protein [Oscillospiraceae bacterium]|nr:DUF3810 family protein [Oscillospiraceae bacterium]
MKRHKKLYCFLIAVAAAAVLLIALSFSQSFCDRYTDHIYPYLASAVGWLTAWLPVALGELLMYAGILLIPATAVILILLAVFRKRPKYRRFAASYGRTLLTAAVCMGFLYAANWVVPFRGSVLGAGGTYQSAGTYSIEQLCALRNYAVNGLNTAAHDAPRDAEGRLKMPEKAEIDRVVVKAMQQLGSEFQRLSGYYPPMKDALCSDVLEWMGIGGFTYPFTMEMTGNKYVSRLYYPVLYAHEACHHKGYYKEHEANFLSYIGCSRSENPILRYSAYYEMFCWLDEAYQQSLLSEYTAAEAVREYKAQPQPDRIVRQDWQQSQEEAEARYAADSHPLKRFSSTAESAAEKGWSTQAKVLGEYNYDGVVALLLQYFDGTL